MSKGPVYRITFINQGQVYEIYAREVHQSNLWGFLEVEKLLFGQSSSLVVDPGEEKLKAEFDGVERTYIPMHSVVRIDEVARQGTPKINEIKGDKITPFPMMMQPKKDV
ncbi:MAG: DUF1820 family protein [Gammaproteobacteria bacterium]|nr:MAG: DUF1820 family protein [Gammaproteobacteria bacterium]